MMISLTQHIGRMAVLVVLCSPWAFSQDIAPEKVRRIHEVLLLSKAKEKFEVGQVEGFKMGFNMSPGVENMPEQKKQKIYALAKEVYTKEMPWDDYQDRITIEMDKVYSDEQLVSLIAFYASDVGKSLVEAEIKLIGPSLTIGAEYGKKLIPVLVERLQGIEE